MPKPVLLCDKDDALITCRKVIIRLLESDGRPPDFLKTYANSVLQRAYDSLDEAAKPVAKKEE